MTYENSCPPSLEDGLSPIPWQSPPLPALSVEDRLRLMLAVSASRHAESALLQCLSRLESDDQRRQATLIARAQARLSALLGEAARLPNGCAAMLTAAALTLQTGACLAQLLPDGGLRRALHFLIPEWQDIAYRIANQYENLYGQYALEWTGGLMEIIPGRPCAACHRHPYDETPPGAADAQPTAVELMLAVLEAQQQCLFSCLLRPEHAPETPLCQELILLINQHLAHIAALAPERRPLQAGLDAIDAARLAALSGQTFASCEALRATLAGEARGMEAQLDKLRTLSTAEYRAVDALPPLPLTLTKGYVRDCLQGVGETLQRGKIVPVGEVREGADFRRYQRRISAEALPSHQVVLRHIDACGQDARFEIAPHPIPALRSRTGDSLSIGR